MQLNSKKESRQQRIGQALKSNLKKRKIFQNKINKEIRKKYREKRDKLKIKEGKSKKHPSNSSEKPIF